MWIAEKNIEAVYQSTSIFHKARKFFSRYEIWLENYSKTINIESNTMAEMVQKDLLPSVLSYAEEIASCCKRRRRRLLPGISCNMRELLLFPSCPSFAML